MRGFLVPGQNHRFSGHLYYFLYDLPLFQRFQAIKKARDSCSDLGFLAPRVGFEPTTLRLTAGCSAVELPRNACAFPNAQVDIIAIRAVRASEKHVFVMKKEMPS